MGLFDILGKIKDGAQQAKAVKNLREDYDFAWNHLLEVAEEKKFRIKNPDERRYKEIKGNIGGFEFEYGPPGSGIVSLGISGMSEKLDLQMQSTTLIKRYGEGHRFKTGDAAFDGLFKECYGSDEHESQLKNADALREQMLRFHHTWVGDEETVGDFIGIELRDERLRVHLPTSVPSRAYHIGEDKALADPEEFKAAVRTFFADLENLVGTIENSLGKSRYINVTPEEKAKREKLDSKMMDYIDDNNEEDLVPAEVKKMLDQGADPNATRSDDTVLMLACRNNHPEVVKMLLDAGAPVDATVQYGETALMVAGENYSMGSVEVLLQGGADGTAVNIYGRNALMHATTGANFDNLKSPEINDVDQQEKHVRKQLRKMITLLKDAGLDLNAMDEEGETAMSRTTSIMRKSKRNLIIEVLKELGAER